MRFIHLNTRPGAGTGPGADPGRRVSSPTSRADRARRRLRGLSGVVVGTVLCATGLAVTPGIAAASGFGTFQAHVTDIHGTPVSGECVTGTTTNGKNSFTTAPSDLTGLITQANVTTGSYTGYYWDCGGAGVGGVPITFHISNGKTTDLGTQQLPATGSVQGRLLDTGTGLGAADVSMTAYDPSSGAQLSPSSCSDANGNYALGGLPVPGVKVAFATGGCSNDSAYVEQWYGGTSEATASVVSVTSGCCGTTLPDQTLADSSSPKVTITSVSITGVSTLGGPSNPTVTVNGTGFGGKMPASQPVPSCPGDPATGLGVNFLKAKLYINDYSAQNWQAGFAPGDCIGLVVSSYTKTQIVFTFGSWYQAPGGGGQGPTGDALAVGDPYTMSVKGAHFTGIVP